MLCNWRYDAEMRVYAPKELVDVVAELEVANQLDGARIAQDLLVRNLSGRARDMYAMCKRNGSITSDSAASKLGISRMNASNILLRMERIRVLSSSSVNENYKIYTIREVT